MSTYTIQVLDKVSRFIDELSDTDKAKVLAAVTVLATDFDAVFTKLLRSPVRELIVKRYRIIFFIQDETIYLVGGFIKKSQKTPRREIENALEIYRQMK